MARSCKSNNKDLDEITPFYIKSSIIACILFTISSYSKANPLNANGTSNLYQSKLTSYNQTNENYNATNIKKPHKLNNMSHQLNQSNNWLQLNYSNYNNISYLLPSSKSNYSKLESIGNESANSINQCIGFESDINMKILPRPSKENKYSESDTYEFTHRKKRPQSMDNLSAQDFNNVKHIKKIESGLHNTSDHRSIIESSINIENKIRKNQTGFLLEKKDSKKPNHFRDFDKKDLTKITAVKKKELMFGPEKLLQLKSIIDKQISDNFDQKSSKLKINYNNYSPFDSNLSNSVLSKEWIDNNQLNLKTTRQVKMNSFKGNNVGLYLTDTSNILQDNDNHVNTPEKVLKGIENEGRPFDEPDMDQVNEFMGDDIANQKEERLKKDSSDDSDKESSCTDVCEAKTLIIIFVGTLIGLIVVVALSFYWWKFSQNSGQEICVECVTP